MHAARLSVTGTRNLPKWKPTGTNTRVARDTLHAAKNAATNWCAAKATVVAAACAASAAVARAWQFLALVSI